MAVDRILKVTGGLTVLFMALFIWKCLKDEKIGKTRVDTITATKGL